MLDTDQNSIATAGNWKGDGAVPSVANGTRDFVIREFRMAVTSVRELDNKLMSSFELASWD